MTRTHLCRPPVAHSADLNADVFCSVIHRRRLHLHTQGGDVAVAVAVRPACLHCRVVPLAGATIPAEALVRAPARLLPRGPHPPRRSPPPPRARGRPQRRQRCRLCLSRGWRRRQRSGKPPKSLLLRPYFPMPSPLVTLTHFVSP
jgi:hypothetical protein